MNVHKGQLLESSVLGLLELQQLVTGHKGGAWELMTDADSQPEAYWIRNSRGGARSMHLNKPTGIRCTSKFENPWSEGFPSLPVYFPLWLFLGEMWLLQVFSRLSFASRSAGSD